MGSDLGSNWQRQATKYLSELSLVTVTVVGALGNFRDQRTSSGSLHLANVI